MTKRKGSSTSKRYLPSSQRRLPAGEKGLHLTTAVSHPSIDQKYGGGKFLGEFPNELNESRLKELRETLSKITKKELAGLIAVSNMDSALEQRELVREWERRYAQHGSRKVEQENVSPRQSRRYKVNSIGVNFPIEASVLRDGSEENRAFRARLHPSENEEFLLDSIKGDDFAWLFRKTTAGWEHSIASAEWRKNSCTIQTQYFKTRLVFDFEKNELKKISYTPIGPEEQRRESKGLMDEGKSEKRIYRKAAERPAPDQPGNAEVNRLKKQFKLRMDPELIAQVKAKADEQGIDQQEWVVQAIRASLKLDPK